MPVFAIQYNEVLTSSTLVICFCSTGLELSYRATTTSRAALFLGTGAFQRYRGPRRELVSYCFSGVGMYSRDMKDTKMWKCIVDKVANAWLDS